MYRSKSLQVSNYGELSAKSSVQVQCIRVQWNAVAGGRLNRENWVWKSPCALVLKLCWSEKMRIRPPTWITRAIHTTSIGCSASSAVMTNGIFSIVNRTTRFSSGIFRAQVFYSRSIRNVALVTSLYTPGAAQPHLSFAERLPIWPPVRLQLYSWEGAHFKDTIHGVCLFSY